MRTTDGPSALATFENARDRARASFGASVLGVTAGAAASADGITTGARPESPTPPTKTPAPSASTGINNREPFRIMGFLCIELDCVSSDSVAPKPRMYDVPALPGIPSSDGSPITLTRFLRSGLDNRAPPVKNSTVSWLAVLRNAPVTASLIAINVLIYVAMVVQSQHLLGSTAPR